MARVGGYTRPAPPPHPGPREGAMTNRRRAGEDRPDPPDRAGAPTRDGESRFASLARHAADMVSVVDADGIIRFANPATERQLGYRPEEVVGTRVERWLHPDDVAPMRAALARRAARPARPPAPIALR